MQALIERKGSDDHPIDNYTDEYNYRGDGQIWFL